SSLLLTTSRALGPTLFPYTTLFRSWRGSAWRWRSPGRSLSLSSSSAPSSPACSDAARPALTDRPRALFATALLQVGTDVAELARSEEHTSELQSRGHLVCRLLLEKK